MEVAGFGAYVITRDSLVVAMALEPDWPSRRTALGRAVARYTMGERPDPAEFRSTVERFRRARKLLAGDDLRAWLSARSLSVDDWRRGLELLLLADDHDDHDDHRISPAPANDIAGALWTVSLVAGRAHDALWQMLLGLAALDEAGVTGVDVSPADRTVAADVCADAALPLDDRDPDRLAAVVATWRVARDARVAAIGRTRSDDVDAVIAQRRLAWTTVVTDEFVFADRSAADEALSCLVVDRASVAELRRRCGVAPVVVGRPADRLAPSEVALLSAEVGGAVGPVPRDGGVAVLVLRERSLPPADELHAAARDVATVERLERRLAGKVIHHVDL